MSSSSPTHVSPMSPKVVSIASSFVAFVDISPMNSSWLERPRSVTLPSVKSVPCGSNSLPHSSMSCSQCRCRIAGLRRSVMSGIVFLKLSTTDFMDDHVTQSFTSRPIFCSFLPIPTAMFSMTSTSRSLNSPSFNPS